MSEPVTLSFQGEIGVISIDNPPVNAMNHAVRAGIAECLARAAAEDSLRAIVLHCAGRTFIAGADIKEFAKPMAPPLHVDVIQQIEDSEKPVVAAIHGTALGGGLETALGCHYRVASPDAKCGLPEVNLGLIPGAGGTQRLPRLVGVGPALKMITSGVPVSAKEALALSLVDRLIEGDLLEGAIAFANELLQAERGPRRACGLNLNGGADELIEAARKEIAAKKKGFEAPLRAIDAVAAAVLPFAEGMAKEKELFEACMKSPQSRAQQHAFFAERQAAKVKDLAPDTPGRPINSAGVLGAGTMGTGIAMAFLNAGIPVTLIENGAEALERGAAAIRKTYESSVAKGRLSQDRMDAAIAMLKPTLDYQDLAGVDLVVEAVFEDMDLKREVFAKLDGVCKQGAILATNTSTLDVNEIAASTRRPEDVIGLHFFSPAHIMKLLEIVRGEKTAGDVIASSLALSRRIRKIPAVVGVCDGFVGNRMLDPYLREAYFLLEEGASPRQVDHALQEFGFAMGPFAMSDLAGLDVLWRIRKRKAATRPKDIRYSEIHDRVCEADRFGQKTGAGIYRYEPGSRTPIPDPEVDAIILKEAERQGIERREISDEEIVERCVYALVNEGARILAEGIAQRASDIDVIYLYGYGFPIYRGGPMFYADAVGLDKVLERTRAFEAGHGKLWTPAPLLTELAESGKRFQDFV